MNKSQELIKICAEASLTSDQKKHIEDKIASYYAFGELEVGVEAAGHSISPIDDKTVKITMKFKTENGFGVVSPIEITMTNGGKPLNFKCDGEDFTNYAAAFSQAYGDEV